MSEFTGPKNDSLMFYANYMGEIKQRVDIIHDSIRNKDTGKMVSLEVGFLQVRKIVEIVALCCLVVHDDFSEMTTNNVKKLYHPNEIFSKLKSVNENCYPQPVLIDRTNGVQNNVRFLIEYIKLPELIKYWNQSGEILHRGTLKKLQRSDAFDLNFSPLEKFVKDINYLLAPAHILNVRRGGEVAVLCVMQDDLNGGKVSVAVVDRGVSNTSDKDIS